MLHGLDLTVEGFLSKSRLHALDGIGAGVHMTDQFKAAQIAANACYPAAKAQFS